MKIISKFFKDFYKWKVKDFFYALGGILLSSLAINMFIVPNHLYNGGVLGVSQLIRSGLEAFFDFSFSFDIAGLISFAINIPLFIIAYKYISKTFFRRTILCVVAQTVFLTFLPIPKEAILDDLLTSILIGGIIGGIGGGMTLSANASGGGTDIIGVMISMHHKNLSVGRIQRAINLTIYSICGILYGISTMIYSIIYAVISSLVVDHTHKQNILSYVMIFTKKKPEAIISFVRDELHRDATYWDAIGGYNDTRTFITYAAMTKYEMQRLERHLPELDSHAFVIKNEGVGIDGNFEKVLTD